MSITATGGPWSRRPWAGSCARRDRLPALALADETAGRRFLERFATARQARVGYEIFLGVGRLFARRGLYARRGAVGQEPPALLVVLEVGDHDLIENLLMHGRIEDRAQHLDPAVEIARHQIGGRDVERSLPMRQAVAA